MREMPSEYNILVVKLEEKGQFGKRIWDDNIKMKLK
jgi:hypothetical protein